MLGGFDVGHVLGTDGTEDDDEIISTQGKFEG